jgi:hypothetical protein
MRVTKARLAPFARGWIVDLAREHTRRVAVARRWCYWCDSLRLTKNLRRVTLAGPARRRVYECREECDGGGTYYIDGVAQQCICTEVQT